MKHDKDDLVNCSKCGGTGRVRLTPALSQTLTALRRRGWATVRMIHNDICRLSKRYRPTVTAINNRLEDLRKFGLAKRERNGTAWLYFFCRKE